MLAAPKSSIVTIWLWARAEIRGLRMGGAERELHGLMQAIGQAARAAAASLAVMTQCTVQRTCAEMWHRRPEAGAPLQSGPRAW